LNGVHIAGSRGAAGVLSLVTGSGAVLVIARPALIGAAVCTDEICPPRRGRHAAAALMFSWSNELRGGTPGARADFTPQASSCRSREHLFPQAAALGLASLSGCSLLPAASFQSVSTSPR